MKEKKRLKRLPRSEPAKPSENVVEDLDLQRRLRKDLKLTAEDIAGIDLELAIEAGLLSAPRRRKQ